MRLGVSFVAAAALAACTAGSGSDHDVVGPFTGPTTRFAIDHITLPTTSSEAHQLGDDLDGDGHPDNGLGEGIVFLDGARDGTSHGDDMIGAGVIGSSIELQATRLDHAASAGATYFGADGDDATAMGGTIVAGAFASNRTRTTHVPGKATLVLPVFEDADPTTVELDAMELDLQPDGSGGYNALVRGGVLPANANAALAPGIIQMIANDTAAHLDLARGLDTNRDGRITPGEVTTFPIIASFVNPEVTLFGQRMTGLAFAAHLVPCPSGGCAAAPADTCFDRTRDGDETDVDCGGSCHPCPGGGACNVATDCQLGACDAGSCRQPSCSDGVRDGFETDVDCGWNCAPCATGKQCTTGADCASGTCKTDCANGICSPTTCD